MSTNTDHIVQVDRRFIVMLPKTTKEHFKAHSIFRHNMENANVKTAISLSGFKPFERLTGHSVRICSNFLAEVLTSAWFVLKELAFYTTQG